jgi:hypothetical protein
LHEDDIFFMVGEAGSDQVDTYLSADLSLSFKYTPRRGSNMMVTNGVLEAVLDASVYDNYEMKVDRVFLHLVLCVSLCVSRGWRASPSCLIHYSILVTLPGLARSF